MRAAGVAALVLVAACAAFERGDEDVSAPSPAGDEDAGGTEPPDAAPLPIPDGATPEAADAAVPSCDDFQPGLAAGFWSGPAGTPPAVQPGILTFRAQPSLESSLATGRRKRGNKVRFEAKFTVHAPNPEWNAGSGTYRLFDADASLDVDSAEYGAFEIHWDQWQTVFRTFGADGSPTTGHNYTNHLAYDVSHTITYEQLFDQHGYVHVTFDGKPNTDLSQDDVITLKAKQLPDWQLHVGAIPKNSPQRPITVDVTHLCVDP